MNITLHFSEATAGHDLANGKQKSTKLEINARSNTYSRAQIHCTQPSMLSDRSVESVATKYASESHQSQVIEAPNPAI